MKNRIESAILEWKKEALKAYDMYEITHKYSYYINSVAISDKHYVRLCDMINTMLEYKMITIEEFVKYLQLILDADNELKQYRHI